MDKALREKLILQYAPLVKIIVGKMAMRLPLDIADKEDLINVGILGLMSALDKYDQTKSVMFETYATYRIKGAIIDELRARDWVPRSTRSKEAQVEKAIAALQKKQGRPPDEEEIAAYLGMSPEDYFKLLDESRCLSLCSYEELIQDKGEEEFRKSLLDMTDQDNPLDHMTNEETRRCLLEAIGNLPQKERLVLALYYDEDLTLKEIGKVMEMTESRVCQLRAQAIMRLRAALKEME